MKHLQSFEYSHLLVGGGGLFCKVLTPLRHLMEVLQFKLVTQKNYNCHVSLVQPPTPQFGIYNLGKRVSGLTVIIFQQSRKNAADFPHSDFNDYRLGFQQEHFSVTSNNFVLFLPPPPPRKCQSTLQIDSHSYNCFYI